MTKMSEARKRRRAREATSPADERPRPAVSCVSCKFLDATNIQQPFCRRFPPQLVVLPRLNDADTGVRKFFPVVDLVFDWCGEYANRADVTIV